MYLYIIELIDFFPAAPTGLNLSCELYQRYLGKLLGFAVCKLIA